LSEAAMTKPVGLLSILLVATAANAAPAPVSEISSPPPRTTVLAPVLLAAAGGHDSVGGLMPLPLWPHYTPHVYPRTPQVWKHKARKCSAHSCTH
jgi:hypothetical protein